MGERAARGRSRSAASLSYVYINIELRSMDYINMIRVMTFRYAFRIFFVTRRCRPLPSAALPKNASVTKIYIYLPHIFIISLPLMFCHFSRRVVFSSRTQQYFIIRFLFNNLNRENA